MSLVYRAPELAATTALTLGQAADVLSFAEDAAWTYDALYAMVVYTTEAQTAPEDIRLAVWAWQEGDPYTPLTAEAGWVQTKSTLAAFATLEEAGRRLNEQRRDELDWLARSLEADDAPEWLRQMVQERWMAGWQGR